ncbi:MAG: hypothetical protein A4S09_03545 [Proteobacteria bacterium SG_bin7]|nr:MAG: hypothetical protein A4S09_03545 [Proteobacteria bacterium SG_bin7]
MGRYLSLVLLIIFQGLFSKAFAVDIPKSVMTMLHINPDDQGGKDGRAFHIFDLEGGKDWIFPFADITGGPVDGQPVHTVLHPNKKVAYVTMSGNTTLPLRLLIIDLNWKNGVPKATLAQSVQILPAKTKDVSDAYCCRKKEMMGDPYTQEGHGPQITDDGKYLVFSVLTSNQLRVFDTESKKLVGTPISGSGLKGPHGFYPNPSATKAATTQYEMNGDKVFILDFDKATGKASIKHVVKLVSNTKGKKVRGAYTHTIRWLDDTHFFVNAGQDPDQGTPNAFEASVWMVDLSGNKPKALLAVGKSKSAHGEDGVQEGVSDNAIANGKLYNAEGNFRKFLDGKLVPGSISVFKIDKNDPSKLSYVTRIKPRKIEEKACDKNEVCRNLPPDYSNAHELIRTPDEKFVFVTSFSSNYLLKIDTSNDSVAQVWFMKAPHGFYIQQ